MQRHSEPHSPPRLINYPPQPATGRTLIESCRQFITACRLKNYSDYTVKNYQRGLKYFMQWCEARAIDHPEQLTPITLNSYRRSVFYYRDKQGQPIKQRSQTAFLIPVRSLFRWLTEQNTLAYNPAASMAMPRQQQELPKNLLSQQEVSAIIAEVDVTAPLGLRDRALLEVAYSTGLRRSELAHLKLQDVNLDSGWVLVEQGKGAKDRRIPIGERAGLWLQKYLMDQRPYLLKTKNTEKALDRGAVFVYANGKPMSADKIYRCIHRYIEQANLGKHGGGHLLRHAMATHMLEEGADIRYIQQMLGHEQLTSTQIYTRVQDNQLKTVHSQTHPAQLKKRANQRMNDRQDDNRRG